MKLEERVQTLEDRAEINQLLADYCQLLDNRDWDRWIKLFIDDAVCDYEAEHIEGKEDISEFITGTMAENVRYSLHTVNNASVTIDGSEAEGRRDMEVYSVLKDDTVLWRQARYDDRFRQVDGRWKFSFVSQTHHVSFSFAAGKELPNVHDLRQYDGTVSFEIG